MKMITDRPFTVSPYDSMEYYYLVPNCRKAQYSFIIRFYLHSDGNTIGIAYMRVICRDNGNELVRGMFNQKQLKYMETELAETGGINSNRLLFLSVEKNSLL